MLAFSIKSIIFYRFLAIDFVFIKESLQLLLSPYFFHHLTEAKGTQSVKIKVRCKHI